MVNKKNIFRDKNILTLLSVLSVLLVFSLICAGCLWALNRMDVFEIPVIVDQNNSAGTGGEDVSLPVHEIPSSPALSVPSGAEMVSGLLTAMPFSDSYYIQVRVETDREAADDLPVSGIYEIWRFGNRYKINRYNDAGEAELTVTCDGSRVQVIDFDAMTNTYHALSSEYRFENAAPLPNFALLNWEAYEIFEYSETKDVCSVTWEYTTSGFIDDVRLSLSSGMLQAFSRYKSGNVIWKIDVLALDLEFIFYDEMFSLS